MKKLIISLFAIVFIFITVSCEHIPSSAPYYEDGFLKVTYNPEANNVTIKYYVVSPGKVELFLYNNQGEEVMEFVNEYQESRHYRIEWWYFIKEGMLCSPGEYMLILACEGLLETEMLIVK